jgi:hypothetical protein
LEKNFCVICHYFFVLSGLSAVVAIVGCKRDEKDAFCLTVGQLSTNIALEVFTVKIELSNQSDKPVKIHGAQVCCGLRFSEGLEEVFVPGQTVRRLSLEGTVPDWGAIADDKFDWDGSLFLEEDGFKIRKVRFTISAARPGTGGVSVE